MRIVIAGASGFIGRNLAHLLADSGHDVTAVSRRGTGAGMGMNTLALDIADVSATTEALRAADAAYYLVHSMGAGADFAARDRALAEGFARAAADAGVQRIVYLGGLGNADELSDHLRSRQEVGRVLASTGVDVVELRAAVILGPGSISFEMMRYLVERLPAMVCPRWVKTPIDPIAVDDVLAYLEESLTVEPGIYEIGGETTTYRELMQAYAEVRGLRPRLIVDVPLLTLHLSSYWVYFVTPVDRKISYSLVKSLSIPVVVTDRARTDATFDVRPRPVREALATALDRHRDEIDDALVGLPEGLHDGVHVVRHRRTLDPGLADVVRRDLRSGGGSLSWYGIPLLWRLRLFLGRVMGETVALNRPDPAVAGAQQDWWRIIRLDESVLVLRAIDWRVGDAWLAWEVDEESSLTVHAAFRPRGVLGLVYWALLTPVHHWVFARMAAHRVRRAAAGVLGGA